jgi:predicted RecB family nuclease
MYLLCRRDGGHFVVSSASDLTSAASCEFGFGRTVDALLGRIAPVEEPDDAMMARTIVLGHAHEERLVEQYRSAGSLIDIERPTTKNVDAYLQRQSETVAAL